MLDIIEDQWDDGTACAWLSTSSASSDGGPYTTSSVIVVTGRSRPR